MIPRDSSWPDAALFIDVRCIASLAHPCRKVTAGLPGLDDDEVRRFMRMARGVDPRPMLLDEDFDLRLRFDLFAAMVEPLSELVRCYSGAVDLQRGRNDHFEIYVETLTLTVRALCAGLELFAAVRASASSSAEQVRTTIQDASSIFEGELIALLAQVTHILDRSPLLTIDEAVALACAVDDATQRMPRLSGPTPITNA